MSVFLEPTESKTVYFSMHETSQHKLNIKYIVYKMLKTFSLKILARDLDTIWSGYDCRMK